YHRIYTAHRFRREQQGEPLQAQQTLRSFRLLPALAVVGSIFSGCSVSASQLNGAEQKALTAKNASVVLLRFAATIGGKPVNVFDGVSFPDIYLAGGFTILAENIDTGDQVKIVQPR